MTKNIIDQTSDPGYATLSVLVDRYPKLLEVSKTAEIDEEGFSKLASEMFAWPSARRFPVYNKEQTALSLGYRKIATGVPPEVDQQLSKAAEVFEIEDDIFEENREKVAQEEYWLLPEKKRYRISSPSDVKIAESLLHEKYAQMSVYDRAEAFHRLGKVAEKLDVTLAPATHKLAGFTVTSTKVLKDWLEARKEASLGSALSEVYEKMAKEYSDTVPYIYDRAAQVKLASAIHELDKAAGLEEHYGRKLPDPVQTVFNTEHISKNQVKIGANFGVDKNVLGELPLSFWEDVLGEDVAKEIAPAGDIDIESLAQILPTLPADLKAVVQRQLTGISSAS